MVVPLSLPLVDIAPYLSDPSSDAARAECAKAADALRTYGAVLLKDPRVSEGDNAAFLDMLERYFAQPHDVKMQDVRKELGYQIGATPEFTEEPVCFRDEKCMQIMKELPEDDKPVQWTGPDAKWRFFHRIGPQPQKTKYPALNAPPVVPEGFKDQWLPTMDGYGYKLHNAVEVLSEMLAVGLGFDDSQFFAKVAKYGPHLLAPTGSDIERFHELNTVFAGFHYDLNLLTIHGKSRFPGLHIWARNTGVKMSVAVPDGCLLVQAGKELEILTGGAVLAGYHEVICNEGTVAAYERAKKEGRITWRISSTLFFHASSDYVLKPSGPFDTPDANAKYPAIECGAYVAKELELIKLSGSEQN
ncbi:hypothetical protein RI367_002977 [Sorochytrium milnesiophthora]